MGRRNTYTSVEQIGFISALNEDIDDLFRAEEKADKKSIIKGVALKTGTTNQVTHELKRVPSDVVLMPVSGSVSFSFPTPATDTTIFIVVSADATADLIIRG